MDVQICYENLRRNLSSSEMLLTDCLYSSKNAQQVPLTQRMTNNVLSYLNKNPVYPLPSQISHLDFARFLVKDPQFCNQEEPFYVVNLSQLLSQHQVWLQNLPRVHPYYAVKCNDDKPLLQLLSSLGCNFDCASKGEIEAIIEMGVDASRIIYANPCKTAGYIKHAKSRDVRWMTFDNEHELYKIYNLYPEAELILRIAVSDPFAVCPLNLKFGCEPLQAAPALLKSAAALGANVIGISFHVGSGCRDPSAFGLGIQYARDLFDFGNSLGFRMNVLDLGGGFPGYKGELAFETIAGVINRALDDYFPEDHATRIIAEPGRFYAASCFTLCCTVVAKTRVAADRISKNNDDKDEVGFMYYINDGVYGSFNCMLYDHVTPLGAPLFDEQYKCAECYKTAVWGPTCDSLDLVQPNVQLPEMFEGEWIVFENMGAYTCAAGSEFNGFPKPTFCYVVAEADNLTLNALLRGEKIDYPNEQKSSIATRSAKFFPLTVAANSSDDNDSEYGSNSTGDFFVAVDREDCSSISSSSATAQSLRY